jgi:hypothetical protein
MTQFRPLFKLPASRFAVPPHSVFIQQTAAKSALTLS